LTGENYAIIIAQFSKAYNHKELPMVADSGFVAIQNPWWADPGAFDRDPHLSQVAGKPFYFDNPRKKKLKFAPGAGYILRGPRQVGKTTFIKEVMKLWASDEKAVDRGDVLFLSCEGVESFSKLQSLTAEWLAERRGRPLLLCLDEITFVDQWQRAILWLGNTGLLQNAVSFITGSNARDLKEMGERFPGRRVKEIALFPLSPLEFANVPCLAKLPDSEVVDTYLSVGGFPHAIRDLHEFGAVTDETYETYANWIFGDAHRYGLARELLVHVLRRVFETAASRVTWQTIIGSTPVKSHETAAAYVAHLESAFLCRVVRCFDEKSGMSAPRKARKMYFIDPLLYAVAGGFVQGRRNVFAWWKAHLGDPGARGAIFEAAAVECAARRLADTYYWYSSKSGHEADILWRRGDEIRLFDVKSSGAPAGNLLGREVTVITPDTFLPFLRGLDDIVNK